MKIARLAGLMLAAIMAVALVAASVASAEPNFTPTGQTFSASANATQLAADNGVDVVKCETLSSGGTVSSATLVSGIVIHFLGCKSSGNGGTSFCTVKSVGASEGLILTATLHGVLGLTLLTTGTKVGLLLLPVKGKEFVALAANSCTVETAVSGNVAGEVEPVGTKTTKGNLLFNVSGGKQVITSFDPSTGGTTTPKLEAFTTAATEEAKAAITFGLATEVT
jgi:hypothetical protein